MTRPRVKAPTADDRRSRAEAKALVGELAGFLKDGFVKLYWQSQGEADELAALLERARKFTHSR